MSAVWDDSTEAGGRDVFHEKNPKANLGLSPQYPEPSDRAKPSEKGPVVSAVVQRLARKLNLPLEEVLVRIPADTIRRTKYPMIERDEDGKSVFLNLPSVIEGPRALHHR